MEIVANLDGLVNDAPWSLHQLPVLTTLEPALRGLDENVGPLLNFPPGPTGVCNIANPGGCAVGDFTGR